MNKNYMLKNDSASKIYGTVKELPIVDYHCHLSPQEIYEDKQFTNIGEIWLGSGTLPSSGSEETITNGAL